MKKNINLENTDSYDRVWKIINEIDISERHLNNLQSRYRTLTSTWLLAVFSAIGFIVAKTLKIQVDIELLVC